jgi:peptidoglycan-N-acetylglucosamine deacetylase
LVELPTHYGVDDWPHYMASRDFGYIMPVKSPSQAMDGFRAEFDAAWEHGGMLIPVWHPFLSGRLARCAAISDFIEYMTKKGDVWFAPTRMYFQ